MNRLDYKESWVPKNWCFWAVRLEKTCERPLDSREIQPVHPNRNQSWIFIGRTDAEAEAPILWPPDAKNWLIWKRPWCWERLKVGGEGEDRAWDGWIASPTQWIGVWVSSGMMMLWKCCSQYASKFGKLSSGHRTGKDKFSFQSQRKEIPKNAQTTTLISHASKVMLKILQTRPQQYMNRELPDVQSGFRKGRGTRDQIANIHWIIEKAREFQKNIYIFFIDYAKAVYCVDHNKLWKILKEMGIPDHLTCLLRNLYTGQEATVRTWNNRLVPNRKRTMSRMYIVTLLI